MSTRFVLAVDGGNSKTDLALLREDGAVLAHVRGGLSSPHHLGLRGSVELLQGLLPAREPAPNPFQYSGHSAASTAKPTSSRSCG